MSKPNLLEVVHFGYGGLLYFVPPGDCIVVNLPDGRVVSLGRLCNYFPATGQLSIPGQPLRVEHKLSVQSASANATINDTGKNMLIDRIPFPYDGNYYSVSPEAYGECLVVKDKENENEPDVLESKRTLIRLPFPNAEVFFEPAWNKDSNLLLINEVKPVERTNERYVWAIRLKK